MIDFEIESVPLDSPLREALKMEGKTIEKVLVGQMSEREKVHQSETIIIYFTDGEILQLTIGTNLQQFNSKLGIKQKQVLADFNVIWKESQ